MIAALTPLMCTDLRAKPAKRFNSTDASTEGLGATFASIPPRLSAELYRWRQRRGAYTRLYTPEAAGLYAEGHIDAEELDDLPQYESPARQLIENFDVLHLFCGKDSLLLNACLDEGLRCGPRIDLSLHAFWDLQSPKVLSWVLFLLRHGRVRYFHSSLPVSTFSRAVRPC